MTSFKLAKKGEFPNFEQDVAGMLEYLKKCPKLIYYQTAQQLLADNIKMHNHIKELENGKPDSK